MCKAFAVAFVIAATLAVTSAQQPIAIGIVRVDGHLMPIARITPKGFEAPHGKPEQTHVNGVAIGPAPFGPPDWPLKGLAWTLANGSQPPVEITTLEKTLVRMPYCDDRYLWRTTLKQPAAPEGIAPIPKIGAAVSGARLEFPDNVISLPDAGSRRVADRIVELFLAREKARLAVDKGVAASGSAATVRITQLVRHVVGGTSTYYFEASKPLKLSDGSVGSDAGVVSGWVVDSAAGLRDYEVAYRVNDDTYKEYDNAVVRGIVPYQGRALWLLERHGWETEYYTLHDWPSGIQRLIVDAYEC